MADYIISERTPLLLSLSLPVSPSPSARAPSLLKNVHIVTREKRGVWLHVSYIVSCLFLFCLPPPLPPSHHPTPPAATSPLLSSFSLSPPSTPIFFFFFFSFLLFFPSLFLSLPPQVRISHEADTLASVSLSLFFFCEITRDNSRFPFCIAEPRHKSIKYGHLILSGAPTVV